MKRTLSIVAAAFISLCANAWADCEGPDVSVRNRVVTTTYDPFANGDQYAAIVLEAEGALCENERIEIELVAIDGVARLPGSGFTMPNGLRFDVINLSGNSITRQNLPQSLAVGLGTTGRSGEETLRLYLRRGQAVGPGQTRYRLAVRTLKNGEMTHQQEFDVIVDVQPSVRVRAAQTVLDLGALQTGERGALDVATYSNVPYEMEFVSERRWALRQQTGDAAGVPYSIVVDSQAPTVSGDTATILLQPTPNGMRVVDLGVQIGAVGQLPAGLYRDYLLIRVTPRSF